MNELNAPLSDAEMDLLDHFLLERIDEDADTLDQDEGVLGISELDGLFTALVSGPISLMPSQWLPAVWGEFPPEWKNEDDFGRIFSLMIRHMNSIAALLMQYPEDFEPLFLEREVDGQTYTIVDEWCEGFQRGVALSQAAWDEGGEELTALLAPVYAFTARTNWHGHDLKDQQREEAVDAIAQNVRALHAHWLDKRGDLVPGAQPVRRSTRRVGRNDPCPCGSGKKYKRCCLN